MQKVKSPLFKDEVIANCVGEFESDKIIELYAGINVDVKRFFNEDKVKLYECSKTGYRFYYPFDCIGDDDFYKDLSLIKKNYYSKRWEHQVALNQIKEKHKVLEIGSGFGAFLKMLKQKNVNAQGIELNPEAIKVCEENELNIHSELIEEFVKDKDNLNKYDVVCFFQVLEHIDKVENFLSDAVKALKNKGLLIIGVPNNNPFLFRKDKYHTLNLPPHHAGLWNYKSLKSLEKLFPLKLEKYYYEPLEKTYRDFYKVQVENSNMVLSITLRLMNKLFPKLLKKLMSNAYDGRNILVIFRKN